MNLLELTHTDESRVACASTALLSLLRSWSGLLHISDPFLSTRPLQSLVEILQIQTHQARKISYETRKVVMDIIFKSLNLQVRKYHGSKLKWWIKNKLDNCLSPGTWLDWGVWCCNENCWPLCSKGYLETRRRFCCGWGRRYSSASLKVSTQPSGEPYVCSTLLLLRV